MGKAQKPKIEKGYRKYPIHTLQQALVAAQKIQDEMAGKPFKKLLLADALGISPSSSSFRDLLSSSYKYGLTDGTEKATEISLTEVGADATQTKDGAKRVAALRQAAMRPKTFGDFYRAYADRKLPSSDMMKKILVAEYGVDQPNAVDCASIITDNGRFVDIIRDISGSAHVLLDAETAAPMPEQQSEEDDAGSEATNGAVATAVVAVPAAAPSAVEPPDRRAIFVGHGKKRGPLEKLQKILSSFQIPHKVVVQEANLGRPISQKVKQTMQECGSAILIFTCDEKFHDESGKEIWRPSENVVYELGAASYQYEDRVVIFKEKGLTFPTNFQSVGYIEFEEEHLDAKTMDLLKELIGFGLVKITT